MTEELKAGYWGGLVRSGDLEDFINVPEEPAADAESNDNGEGAKAGS